MYTMSEIELMLQNLAQLNKDTKSQIITDIINDHQIRAQKMEAMYKSFKGNTPILTREFEDENKLNNKIVADYRGDIINTVTGYVFGNPIARQINKTRYTDAIYQIAKDTMDDFLIRNNMEDVDAEVGKYAAICGYGAKLLYIDTDGNEACTSVKPWKCAFIGEATTGKPQYALFYETRYNNGKPYLHAELYDKLYVTTYAKENETFVEGEIKPHMFGTIPLIKYANNDEELGDFEKVETLIDSYEKIVSDVQNEAEEMRLAYMLFYGVNATAETLKQARQTGGFTLDPQNQEKIEFLTKNINIQFIENHKKTLNENIYKFAKVVDMSDESFAGNQSGESRKWKLLGLENKAITKERKFNTGDRQMFKALQTPWGIKGISINYIDIFNQFTRNIPVELSAEADIIQKLGIKISQKTALSLLSVIDDPDYEIKQIQLEAEEARKAQQVITPTNTQQENTQQDDITE